MAVVETIQPVFDFTPYLTQLFIAVVTAVIAIVGNGVRSYLKAHVSKDQIAVVDKLASVAVQAAEQVYGSAGGADKKAYAIDYVQTELARRGIKVDASSIETAIEAAVMTEFNFPDTTAVVVATPADASTGTGETTPPDASAIGTVND